MFAAVEASGETVRVEDAGPLLMVTGLGLKLAPMLAGSPLTLKATLPVKPLAGVTVTV